MRKVWNIVVINTLIFILPITSYPSERYIEQISTIILFYETLSEEKSPTVSDFFILFGRDDKAELEMILRQEFPSVEWKGRWFENQEALKYIDEVLKNPHQYKSRFLKCIKSAEPTLFADKVSRQIEFPPMVTKDFKKFNVMCSGRGVVFEFSQDERFIENIYLPDGKSIYSLIERCIKIDNK